MFLQTSFSTEYQSEVNLVLTLEDYGNRITDLLYPVRQYVSNQDILTFSLTRYCGGDSRLALYAQWSLIAHQLTLSPFGLVTETELYIRENLPVYLRDSQKAAEKIRELAMGNYLYEQLEIIFSIQNSLGVDVLVKSPFLKKIISRSHLNKVTASQIYSLGYWRKDEMLLEDFLKDQQSRVSYLIIGYPVILGMMANFYHEESPINPKAVKWDLLEQIIGIISGLHQTGRGFELEQFLAYSQLNKNEKTEWLHLSLEEIKKRLLKNDNIMKEGKQERLKLHREGTVLLESIVLPDKFSSMLKDLLDWSLSLNFVK